MEGTKKQVEWATEIQATFESALVRAIKKEDLSVEQVEALRKAVADKDAAWWIKVSVSGRIKGHRLVSEVAEYHCRGFHKIPGTKKAGELFF